MRIAIKICYDGTNFSGWQIQPNKRTVEGELTSALSRIAGQKIPIIGSGRTDAGVHAIGQIAHFDLEKSFDIKKIPAAMNFYLNDDVRVVNAEIVADDFHARKSAKRKTYIYKMYMAEFDNPLLKNRQLRIDRVDLSLMNQATQLFVGTHDFRAFMSSGSSVATTTREVHECAIATNGNQLILTITANGFLYNMVRKIAAALLQAGYKKKPIHALSESLAPPFPFFKDTAPAHALYLYGVEYVDIN